METDVRNAQCRNCQSGPSAFFQVPHGLRHWLTLTFGNNDYDTLDNLQTCEQDAAHVHTTFHTSGLCRKDDQKLLSASASAADIRAAVSGMVDRMQHGSSLWISYFGHGFDHKGNCIVPTSKFDEKSSNPWTEAVALSSLAKSCIAGKRLNNATLVCAFACCRSDYSEDDRIQSVLARDSTAETRPDGFRLVEVYTCEPAHDTNDLSLIAGSFCYLLMRRPTDLEQFLKAWKSELWHVTLTGVCLDRNFDPRDSDTTKMFSSGFALCDAVLQRNTVEWWEHPARVILAWHLRCMVDVQLTRSPSSILEMLRRYETARSLVREMGERSFAGEFCQLPEQIPLLRCKSTEEVMKILEPSTPSSDSRSLVCSTAGTDESQVDPLDPRTECIPRCVLQTLAECIEGHENKQDVEDLARDLFQLLNWLGEYHHACRLSGESNLTHVTCVRRQGEVSESEHTLDEVKQCILLFCAQHLFLNPAALLLRGSLWIMLFTSAALSAEQSSLLVECLNKEINAKGRFRRIRPADIPCGMLRLATALPFNGKRPICMLWKQREVGVPDGLAIPPSTNMSTLHKLRN